MEIQEFEHTKQDCPAFGYCEALKSLGVEPQAGRGCLFEIEGGVYRPTEATATALFTPSDKGELVEALAVKAVAELNNYRLFLDDQEEFSARLELHQALFTAHMTLWQAMIDAARQARSFTDIELDYYELLIDHAKEALQEAEEQVAEKTRSRAQCAHDYKLKDRYQIHFEDTMVKDINRLVSNIVNVRPTLIVGDKGVAKTQIAKFVMGLYGQDPIVVSVKGDMMSDELIGKVKHDRVNNTFVFQDGILLTAMRKGLPILLDEINFGDQAIIARLQDILLRRPGEQVFVQESGDEHIPIAPGFMVFATANEASLRYRHREILDPAVRDRFDIVMRSYPDLEGDPLIEAPGQLLRLALSSAVDARGVLSPYIDRVTLEGFVRLSHITQYLYAVPAKDVTLELVDDRLKSVVLEESQPLMTDCITPRTLSNVVADCADGNLPDRSFNHELIDRLLKSLDQAGSSYNYELAEQARTMLGMHMAPGENGTAGV